MWQRDENLRDFLHTMVYDRPEPGLVRRPKIDPHCQCTAPGLFVVGDLAGAPLLKISANQGARIIDYLVECRKRNEGPIKQAGDVPYDVAIIGAGAGGLSTAREAQKAGLRYLLLEQGELGNTITIFPEGKILYAEPVKEQMESELWLEDKCTKEELLREWARQAKEWDLDIHEFEGAERITRRKEGFRVETAKGTYDSHCLVLAIGKFGNPRRLGIPGEELDKVSPYLRHPERYKDKDLAVVGGGDVSAEAALTLLEDNRVTMIVRDDQWVFPQKENQKKLNQAMEQGKLTVHFKATAKEIGEKEIIFEKEGEEHRISNDATFVMIGQELPEQFLKEMGVELEGEWNWKRWATLAAWLLGAYSIFGLKSHLWPFSRWPAETFEFFGLSTAFWYSLLFTALVVGFGIPAMRKWGKEDRYQKWRYLSLMSVQVVFGFAVPELVFNVALQHPEYWRFYGLEYAWPLFFNTFFDNPGWFFVIWGALYAFVFIPIFVLFHGKRYCTWICGCGALAETLGDRWRTSAPKGARSRKWEVMNVPILGLAAIITLSLVADLRATWFQPQEWKTWYSLYVDLWLVGIIAITVYPIWGGKIWCRYWCPLAKYMEWLSMFYRRLGWAKKVQIDSNDKCIRCGECSRHCEVGINVMAFAMNQQPFDNTNTSCIQCGMCITVCPVDVLTFGSWADKPSPLTQIQSRPSA